MENSKKIIIANTIGLICLVAGILGLIIFFIKGTYSELNLPIAGLISIVFGIIMMLLARKKPSN